MMGTQNIQIEETDDGKVLVRLSMRHGPSSGMSLPIGRFDNVDAAGRVALFIHDALHDEYMRGSRDAYASAMKAIESFGA